MEENGDLGALMLDGMHRFVDRQTVASVANRAKFWNRDFSSRENYEKSIAPNRAKLAEILGVVDQRVSPVKMEYIDGPDHSSLLAMTGRWLVHAVRWESLAGVFGEGLVLYPQSMTLSGPQSEWFRRQTSGVADVIVLTDADETPEMSAGLVESGHSGAWAQTFADAGCRVIVPALVDRSDKFSVGMHAQKITHQPDREFIYRPAFEMGRHVIGYEIQKVLAAVDWLSAQNSGKPIIVVGYGEGGLLALCCGALDPRISIVGVSGYFGPREQLWREPIYRNVFGLLKEFGDAEIASLIAPRDLIIGLTTAPVVTNNHNRPLSAVGAIPSFSEADVCQEAQRAHELVQKIVGDDWPVVKAGILKACIQKIGGKLEPPSKVFPNAPLPDNTDRQRRAVQEMSDFTQKLVHDCEPVREKLWEHADKTSPEKWEESTAPLRKKFYNDVIGKFDEPLLPPNARTRKIFDEPKYTGYEVQLDVWPDVFDYGILLVPKGMKTGERRPVVVCQHGLEGRVREVADPKINEHFYHHFACQLADQGFITYAPQNPYILGDRFRTLQRKLNPLGKQLYSIIIPQHEQLLNWLSSLDFVDPKRIAFYGLSYGGKTAVRMPSVVTRYCLSICSGDFNQYTWKTTSLDFPSSFALVEEPEIFEWNLGHTFDYAEMTALIAPRPFMVERGHRDGVAPDTWVAYEYAKVRLLYADLKIPDRTRIEFFDGPHTIHGVGTFAFLREKLDWHEK